jgi:hypothetical protein
MSTKKIIKLFLIISCCSPVMGFAQKVVVTPNGGKYHVTNCRTITTSTQTKAVDVTDAQSEKLTACSVCKPPTKANATGVQCSAKKQRRCKMQAEDGREEWKVLAACVNIRHWVA